MSYDVHMGGMAGMRTKPVGVLDCIQACIDRVPSLKVAGIVGK